MKKNLTKQDEVVLEMTTNTWQLYDELIEYAGKVIVVHPPHVGLITRSQVMNDKIAASILARLLAKGLLVGIWVPPQEVRELRGLVAQRQKMTRLGTQAKNRLHAVIQRHHLKAPVGNPFAKTNNGWWQGLALGKLEKMNLQSDLETLQFAEGQEVRIEKEMTQIAAEDESIGRLLQISGFGVITATTVYAAIGDIRRFPEGKKLVGYAGLGARVHDSGMTTRRGEDHESRQARLARCDGGSGERSGGQQSALESGTGALGTAVGAQQSDRGDCAEVAGNGMACVAGQGRQICRAGSSGAEDAEVCLLGWESKSRRKNGSAVCARTFGRIEDGSEFEQHPLGCQEADPFTALEVKRRERRPK
jgi:hypothetical protein